MRTRKLGYTDLELTAIALGAWAIGGGEYAFGWGPQDDADSIATIHRALDLGINWIDTAPAYGLGRSEEIVGRAIRGRRDQVIVATKCGLVWDEGSRQISGRLRKDSVRREIDASLRRLAVERIDLYQIHWPDPEPEIEEGWSAIAQAINAGKIRYGGVSNFSVDQIRRVQKIHPVASLQPPYSMFNRKVEDELLPFCARERIGVVAYSPMQSGLLTGKVTREWVRNLPEDDFRKRAARYQEPQLSRNLEIVEKLSAIAAREGHTVAQLAIAWVLRREEVTAAIVGARRPQQIEETAAAGDWALSPEVVEQVEQVLGG